MKNTSNCSIHFVYASHKRVSRNKAVCYLYFYLSIHPWNLLSNALSTFCKFSNVLASLILNNSKNHYFNCLDIALFLLQGGVIMFPLSPKFAGLDWVTKKLLKTKNKRHQIILTVVMMGNFQYLLLISCPLYHYSFSTSNTQAGGCRPMMFNIFYCSPFAIIVNWLLQDMRQGGGGVTKNCWILTVNYRV